MKVINATGRFIASPLGAVLFCAAGSFGIWYGMGHLREGAPKAGPRGEQARARGNPAVAKTDGARESPDPLGGIAARRRPVAGQRKQTARREAVIEEVQAEVEPPAPSREAAAADRPERGPGANAGESTTATIADMIGPRDPRAKALLEYQAKKAAVPDGCDR